MTLALQARGVAKEWGSNLAGLAVPILGISLSNEIETTAKAQTTSTTTYNYNNFSNQVSSLRPDIIPFRREGSHDTSSDIHQLRGVMIRCLRITGLSS
ncbi:hypothetical protein BD410DRAFT_621288 [Rickenella mellea]|uniref:Uncharacterized protein n=1 Tax=Rickenella mellea TaxID=50990 RepID=A0A4Y7PM83_9AGAM|nr:hypothetical protein BD410DRAFT_621288 [Rickenella mellea]